VQRMLLAKYHVNDPVTFFSTSDFWDVPLDPNPTASSFQPPYYIVAKNIAKEDNSASFQLTSAMNRFKRDYLAAYISASSDPATYGKITVLTIPGQVNGPKLANNAITTDTAVSQDLGVIGRDNQNRIKWGNLLTLPVAQGGLLYVEPVLRATRPRRVRLRLRRRRLRPSHRRRTGPLRCRRPRPPPSRTSRRRSAGRATRRRTAISPPTARRCSGSTMRSPNTTTPSNPVEPRRYGR
jgi:hypothetical protein